MLRSYTGVGYYLICLPVRVPVDRRASGEADNRIGLSMKAQLVLRRADRFVLHLEYNNINIVIDKPGGQPDVPEYTVQMHCTNANEISTQNADKSLINDFQRSLHWCANRS